MAAGKNPLALKGEPRTPLSGPAAERAREALDRYNQAIERLKSGDWAGFGTELDAMRGLLEDMSRQSAAAGIALRALCLVSVPART